MNETRHITIQCIPNNHININHTIKDSSRLNYPDACIDIRFTLDMYLYGDLYCSVELLLMSFTLPYHSQG